VSEPAPQFHRSSFCGPGNCVEVAFDGDRVLVRDSKHPEHGHQLHTRESWAALVDQIKAGRHDLP
jgi:hypothetical protein